MSVAATHRRRRLDAVLSLPDELFVDLATLGKSVRSRLGGVAVELTFPELDPDDSFHHLGGLCAPHHPTMGRPPEILERTAANRWGYARNPGVYSVQALRAAFLVSVSSGEHPSEAAEVNAMALGVPSWFAIVNSWLCAWLNAPAHQPRNEIGGSSLLFVGPDGSVGGRGPDIRMTVVSGLAAVSPSLVRRAFAHGGHGSDLPLEHKLLLDARTQFSDRDHRRAVIDAGTAAEAALAAAITEELRSRNVAAKFRELAIRDASGVVGLLDLYESLGHVVPVSKARTADRLAEKGNRAAHAGREPSTDETFNAIQVASAIVHGCRPLEAPGSASHA